MKVSAGLALVSVVCIGAPAQANDGGRHSSAPPPRVTARAPQPMVVRPPPSFPGARAAAGGGMPASAPSPARAVYGAGHGVYAAPYPGAARYPQPRGVGSGAVAGAPYGRPSNGSLGRQTQPRVFGRGPNRVFGARGAVPVMSRQIPYHGYWLHPFLAPRFVYPAGYGYYRYSAGDVLPLALFSAAVLIADYSSYGLNPPPEGEQWMRFGPDALLVNPSTLRVDDSAGQIFDESLNDNDSGASASYPPVDPSLPSEFQDGALHLVNASPGGCTMFYQSEQTRARIRQTVSAKDWNALAITVVKLNCDTDLAYYYLGSAAENLGLKDAASNYYNIAMEYSQDQSADRYHSCKQWRDGCQGVSIVDASGEALGRLGR